MRFLPALLLIAAPLLAQEPSEEERQSEAERRAMEEWRLGETQAQAKKKQYKELRRLLEQFGSKNDATRKKAMEALKQANMTLEEMLPLIAEALEKAERVRGDLGDLQLWKAATLHLGTEAISGSAEGTDYTLRSLGDGKYDLHATKRAEDGRLMVEWKDQGTMKELQEKYAFLRSGLAIQTPAVAAQPVRVKWGEVGGVWRGRVVQDGNAQNLTWNGGGRVGVNVTPPPEELRFHLRLPEGAGFIVQQVVPGSRAEEIGIRRMDILLKLDGELIDSPIQLKRLHEKKGVLEIIRRSEAKAIDLATVPEEKPAEIPPEKVTEEPAPAAGER